MQPAPAQRPFARKARTVPGRFKHNRPTMPFSSLLRVLTTSALACVLVACSTPPAGKTPSSAAPSVAPVTKSRWVPVPWSHLQGMAQDDLHDAWNAWLKSCERPPAPLAPLCSDVRRLSIASHDEKWQWLQSRMQPYRVESRDGRTTGLLTAYYEPELIARRQPDAVFRVPLYGVPAGFDPRTPWFTRQEIDTLEQARTALQGRELAWINDPVDALVLHIQGSGRLHLTEPDGRQRQVRMAFAATNGRPYGSVGKWLLDQRLVRDATWPGISAWIAANPHRTQELMWNNPRYVFFREEPLDGVDALFGPKGAQGVALTPGRSIAVDRASIPYGTPVWMSSTGPQTVLNRLVMAQDTGSAITGAVRADYFAGWGKAAGDFAGRIKQELRLWVLWPAGVPLP